MEKHAPKIDLAALRADYARGGLSEEDLAADPFTMFDRWMAQALEAGLHEPNALVVSTVSAAGVPSSRMVLLKGVSPEGFVFFTNLESRKGQELEQNPACALLFPWHPLERQIRIEGRAQLLPRADVDEYFAVRPRGSRVGAWASPQSQMVHGRAELDRRYASMMERFGEDGPVPVPGHWGGFVVVPDAIEFWQGRPGRMHDRLVYRRSLASAEGWTTERLAP